MEAQVIVKATEDPRICSLYEVVLWVEQNPADWKDCTVEENLVTQQKIGGW